MKKVLFILLLFPVTAISQVCDYIDWVAPDYPTALTYRVYNGLNILGAGSFPEVDGRVRAECEDLDMPDGRYVVTITAVNVIGEESDHSESISFDIRRMTPPLNPAVVF